MPDWAIGSTPSTKAKRRIPPQAELVHSSDDPTAVVVITTMPDEDSAGGLAARLVEDRVIACANVVPGISSIYRWEGGLKCDAEVLIVMKTSGDRADELTERIGSMHPYDVPEILVLPVRSGHLPYLDWIAGEVAR